MFRWADCEQPGFVRIAGQHKWSPPVLVSEERHAPLKTSRQCGGSLSLGKCMGRGISSPIATRRGGSTPITGKPTEEREHPHDGQVPHRGREIKAVILTIRQHSQKELDLLFREAGASYQQITAQKAFYDRPMKTLARAGLGHSKRTDYLRQLRDGSRRDRALPRRRKGFRHAPSRMHTRWSDQLRFWKASLRGLRLAALITLPADEVRPRLGVKLAYRNGD
jgi:hypothetical protein